MDSARGAMEGSQRQEFVISRTFDAPVDRMYRAWSEEERLKAWFGPKGFKMPVCRLDLRPGGTFHYGLETPDGIRYWEKFVYRQIAPPARLVWVNSFSDESGGVTRNPWSPTWPLELLTTVTFTAEGGKTLVTVRWSTISATDEEARTFRDGHDSMRQGWTGTFDQLDAYLAAK